MPARRKPVEAVQDRRPGRAQIVALRGTGGVASPAPPRGLLKSSVSRWEAFFRSSVAAAVDVDADLGRLERWIRAVDEHTRAVAALRKKRVVVGSTGQPVLSPLAAYVRQLEQTIASAEVEFGMTPASRLKLGLTAGQARLTAEQLNRMLDERAEPGVIEAEGAWTSA